MASVQEAVRLQGVQWITLLGGTWRCPDARRLERDGIVARLMFGRIAATEVPIFGEDSQDLVVARFGGDRGCPQSEAQLSGVVGSVEVFTSRESLRRWRAPGRRVAVLNVDASPWKALELFMLISAVLAGGVVFSCYYLRLLVLRAKSDEA